METGTKMGSNRTGVQASPIDSKEMLQGSPRAQQTPGDASELAQLRKRYLEQAGAVGSMPPPGTAKGVVQTGVQMLSGNYAHVFLDKLGERLAFERTGTRLYEALIAKCDAAQQPGAVDIARLRHFRDEEHGHMQLLVETIESLGGDPTVMTPCADAAGVEAMGLLQVVTDPRMDLAQSLQAVLVAELADNASWEMLTKLATEVGKDQLARKFVDPLQAEQEHLQTIRAWLESLTSDMTKMGGAV